MRLESSQIKELGTQLALSAVGPGLLALPFGVSRAGLPLSAALLALFVYLSARVVLLIDNAKYVTPQHPTTYIKLTEVVLGTRWKRAMECVVVLNGLGVCISFMIFLGGFAPPAIQTITARYFPQIDCSIYGTRSQCLMLFSIITICLSSIKDFSALKWLNLIPVGGLLYTTIYLTIRVIVEVVSGEIVLSSTLYRLFWHMPDYQTLLTPNIFLFTTMMQVNVLPIMTAFPNTMRHDIVKSLRYGHGSLFAFYLCLATVGFISSAGTTPHGTVSQNFTNDLPITDLSVALLRIVLVLTLLSIAPYQFVAIASSMLDLVKRLRHDKKLSNDQIAVQLLEKEETYPRRKRSCPSPIEETTSDDEDQEYMCPPLDEIPDKLVLHHSLRSRLLAASVLIGIALLTALMTDKVATLVSITGGIGSTTLMCTTPFFIQRRVDPSNKFIWLLAATSIVCYTTTILVFIDILR